MVQEFPTSERRVAEEHSTVLLFHSQFLEEREDLLKPTKWDEKTVYKYLGL